MRREVQILNELGLHARPAAEFVRTVQRFKNCEIVIIKEEETFSAASILEVLSANLDCGSRMIIEATGVDEERAVDELSRLLEEFKLQEERERA